MSGETEDKKRSSNKLKRSEWAQIEALWANGESTLAELSEKYGVKPETISRKMKQRGVKKGSRIAETEARIAEKMQEEAAKDADIVFERRRETEEQHYNHAKLLASAAMQLLAKANQDKRALSSVEPDLKAIERASKIQQTTMDMRRKILGMDKEDAQAEDIPELIISEMTAEDIEHARNRNRLMEEEELGMTLEEALSNVGEYEKDKDSAEE